MKGKADVNKASVRGTILNPLASSIWKGDLKVIKILLRHGADLDLAQKILNDFSKSLQPVFSRMFKITHFQMKPEVSVIINDYLKWNQGRGQMAAHLFFMEKKLEKKEGG